MSADDLRAAVAELESALSIFVDEFAKAQAPRWDDQGDLDFGVSQLAPALEAVTEALVDEFEHDLGQLKYGVELDEVLSLLAHRWDDEGIEAGAEAATRLLYVIQGCSYGSFSDPDPEAEDPDIEDDASLLQEVLDAILESDRIDEEGDEDDEEGDEDDDD